MSHPLSQTQLAHQLAMQQAQIAKSFANQQALGSYLGRIPAMTYPMFVSGLDEARARRLAQPVEKLPLEIGEIIGWRAWRLAKNGLLQSLAHDNIWLPGEIMGHNDDHSKIKIEDHGCAGVYAFSDRGYALKDTEFASTPNLVFGSVRLWGTVVEHEHGYRAEFATVHSIDAVNVGDGHWWKRKAETNAALTALRGAYLSVPAFVLSDEAA
ncbi:MAG: hypothetical protein KGJ13_05255 [Patescibacteria group bacterium]|nr:hypothetical protein [Patescibacteria group bacterium]